MTIPSLFQINGNFFFNGNTNPYSDLELKLLKICEILKIDWEKEIEYAKQTAKDKARESFVPYETIYENVLNKRYEELAKGDISPNSPLPPD